MSFKKNFFKNTIQLASYGYIGETINFLASLVIARLLTPDEFGFVAMIYVLSNFASVFAGAGFGSDIIRKDYGYTYHKAMLNLSFYIGVLLVVIMILLAYPLALFYDNKALIIPTLIISIQFFYKSLSITYYSLLMKAMKFRYLGRVNLAGTLLSVILMIAMAFLGFSYWSLIFPVLIADFVKYLLFKRNTDLKFKLHPFKYSIVAFRESKSIVFSMLGIKTISYWANNVDNILVGKVYGEYTLGIYNRAYRFINLTWKLISQAFGSVLYPSLKKHQDEKGDIHKEFLGLLGVLAVISFPIGATLILIPDLFVTILWGKNWLEVAELLPYFGLYILSLPMRSSFDVMYRLLLKEKLMFYLGSIASVLTVSAIILGLQYSIVTIAQCIVLVTIAITLPMEVYFGFIKGFSFKKREMLVFWGIKILLYLAIFASVYMGNIILIVSTMSIYFIHLVLNQRKELVKAWSKILSRYKKK